MNDKAPLLTKSELDLLDQALGFYCEDGISEDQEAQQEVQQLRDKITAAPALLASLEALVAQLVETSAYDFARKGEDPGLLADVEKAEALIASLKV